MKYIFVLAFLICSIGMQAQVIQPGGPTTFCAGGNVSLSINPPPATGSFQWLKDGIIINGATGASYTANAAGSYKVIITNGTKKDTLAAIAVSVNALPNVTVNNASFCTGLSATLTALGADTYSWSPPTGLSATTGSTVIANPSVTTTYTITGKNTLTGCSKTVSSTVTVNPNPSANFTFTPNACSGTNVIFNSNITGGTPGYTYNWDFGENGTSNVPIPSHAFTSLGCDTANFNVKLTVTDSKACSSFITKTVIIKQAPNVQVTDTQSPGTPFSNCANDPSPSNPNYTIVVGNISPSMSCITNYSIDWGDNTLESNIIFPISHTYLKLGAFNLKVTAFGSNGCNYTKSYPVANQKNPDIGIGTFGLTEGCANLPVNIVISSWATNSPGTSYLLQFGDGDSTSFMHPINQTYSNDTIIHTYTTTSCPDKPVYNITITATNACRTKSFVGGDIVVKIKPQSDFMIIRSPSCVGESVCFANTTKSGYDVNCNVYGKTLWDFGDPLSGNEDTSTLNSPCHIYNNPGIYTVSLTTTNVCGPSTMTHTVCVTGKPTPDFKLSDTSICASSLITAANTTNNFNSCQLPVYAWTVDYVSAFCGTSSSWIFAPGSSDTSTNPSFIFNNFGIYNITLTVTNACGPFTTTQSVSVKKPPSVGITIPPYPCGPVTITPIANDTSCSTGASTYLWTFAGGAPNTSTDRNPGPVNFVSPGTHAISLAVTNECGTTSATENVIVTVAPDVTATADKVFCAGNATTPINFSSTVNPLVYNWKNSNTAIGLPSGGSGNIASFVATNNGTTPLTATIIVTPFVSESCNGKNDTFNITVNPAPAPPLAASPVIYCMNATAAPLSATATAGNSLTWYNNSNLSGGSTTAPVPVTSNSGSTYYVTQTNSFGCASPAAVINVAITPSITGNVIAADQTICANTIPAALTTLNAVGGGSGTLIYFWQSSTDGGITWANITGTNNEVYSPPALSSMIKYRRVINSNTCSDTSNNVTITVQGALANYDISASQVICEGTAPASLTGALPTGGGGAYSYTWESSTDNIIWNPVANTGQNYQPPALTQTTYFRRRVVASQCSAVSQAIIITVNPTPTGNTEAPVLSICEYDSAGILFNATAGTAPFIIQLKITGPQGTDTLVRTVNNNGPAAINIIPANSNPGNYTITLVNITDNNQCARAGNISTTSILVKPKPVLTPGEAPTICSGNSTLLTVSGADMYSWAPAIGLSGTTGNSVTGNPTVTTTYTITGTSDGCINTAMITVNVTPGATVAATGPPQVLCNVATAVLNANAALIGTGSWKQLSGPAVTITGPSKNNSTLTGLSGGKRYVFTWTITGLPPCPPTSANDTIDVLSPIINSVKNDTIICLGQRALLVTRNLSGGSTDDLNAQYTYQWQASPPSQDNWQTMAGETSETLLVSPNTSTCYRRRVQSNNSCDTASNVVCITVNPTITNNTISAAQQVCVNVLPSSLTGSTPTGGDNKYAYAWQTSIDSVNWVNIGTDINYQPTAYPTAGINYFRRNVISGNCTDVSNVIAIKVRPDSKALFTASRSIACAPFDLAGVITVAALPDSNGLYQWYADEGIFGSNNTGVFPGYKILNPADTVLIKLVTTSQYGCKPDSIQQRFITLITAQAKFFKDTSFGCGPLPVKFTNTTNLLDGIQFFWDFGNGSTSNTAQPDAVSFNSSPFFNDTTYQVTLKAYNGCDTTIWRDSVKVRANPKARFGVDTTFGCSPFKVLISNSSSGGPNIYYWDFGDGKKDTTFTHGTFMHPYNVGNAVDTFTIRLIAANECRRDTQSINIRVAPNPIRPLINVNGSQLFGCAPHIVSFNNNTTGATGYTWNFGDGTAPIITNNDQNVVEHEFDSAGIFTVSVEITNGCSDTTVFSLVTVYGKPSAAFTLNSSSFCAGDTVKVVNVSQNATNYRWFWGDGNGSTLSEPTHIFTVSGDYNILLRAERTNNTGLVCADTVIRPVTIFGKPVVTVQSNINAINCAPFTLKVSAPGITVENVTWSFYDSTVTPALINSNGIPAQYTFNKPGTFYVKLLASNARDCKDSTIIPFTVRGKAVASFTPSNLAVCTQDTTINYTSTSTYNGIDPISYQWLVDNVLISTGANFTHNYNAVATAILPKVFSTKLVVSNTVGCSDTATATLQMNPVAKAQFSISNPSDCVPFNLSIKNTSTYTTAYHWLLNGTAVSDDPDPVIVIRDGATPYTVTLLADNIYGCKPDTFPIKFTSRARPKASFKLSDTLGCTGILNVATTNLTTGAASYIWNWGDGTANSFFNNPTHLYTNQGEYLITLVASDGVCTDTTEQPVKISIKPVVDFSVDQTLTCDTARVQFTNLTTNGTNFAWSFGDGSFSNAINPSKSFAPNTVPYTVKLVASSTFGCKDSAVKPNLITAKLPPASDFFISPSPVITVPHYEFSFNNLTLNSTNYKYLWSLGDGTFATTRDVTHKYADTGNYTVQLIVLDTATNCPDTTVKIARIDGFPGYLYVPNAICPACLQSNLREFLPKGTGLKEYRLQIYTTWNELIFETRVLDSKGTPTVAWDGKFKGTIVQQDVYVWRIDAKFLNGSEWLGMIYPGDSKYKKVGTITVIK